MAQDYLMMAKAGAELATRGLKDGTVEDKALQAGINLALVHAVIALVETIQQRADG